MPHPFFTLDFYQIVGDYDTWQAEGYSLRFGPMWLGMFYISDLLGGAKNLLIGNVIKSQVLNARDWPFGAATSIALTIAMAIMLYAYYRAGKLLNKKVELD